MTDLYHKLKDFAKKNNYNFITDTQNNTTILVITANYIDYSLIEYDNITSFRVEPTHLKDSSVYVPLPEDPSTYFNFIIENILRDKLELEQEIAS